MDAGNRATNPRRSEARDLLSRPISRREALGLLGLAGLSACREAQQTPVALERSFAKGASDPFVAQGLAAHDPRQAVLLTGGDLRAYGVSLTSTGYRLDLGDETVRVLTRRMVFEPSIIPGQWLIPGLPPRVPPLPAELADADSDCALLDHVPALDRYLADAEDTARALADRASACMARVRDLHREVAELLDQVGSKCGIGAADLDALTPPASFVGPLLCNRKAAQLDFIPVVLEELGAKQASCADVEARLTALRDRLGQGEPVCESLVARLLHRARWETDQVPHYLALLDELMEGLDEQGLQASCDGCDDDSNDGVPTRTGAVIEQSTPHVLGRYVGAFRSAAATAQEPDRAEALGAIAMRLTRVPDDRVKHVRFASASAVGQDHIAVAPSGAPDDGTSPRVLVLSALPRSAPLPSLNLADLALLRSELRGFRRLLVGGKQ